MRRRRHRSIDGADTRRRRRRRRRWRPASVAVDRSVTVDRSIIYGSRPGDHLADVYPLSRLTLVWLFSSRVAPDRWRRRSTLFPRRRGAFFYFYFRVLASNCDGDLLPARHPSFASSGFFLHLVPLPSFFSVEFYGTFRRHGKVERDERSSFPSFLFTFVPNQGLHWFYEL